MDQDLKKAEHDVDLAQSDLYLARHPVPTKLETMVSDLVKLIKLKIQVNEGRTKEGEVTLAQVTAMEERSKAQDQRIIEVLEKEVNVRIRIQERLKLLKRSEEASVKNTRNQA